MSLASWESMFVVVQVVPATTPDLADREIRCMSHLPPLLPPIRIPQPVGLIHIDT